MNWSARLMTLAAFLDSVSVWNNHHHRTTFRMIAMVTVVYVFNLSNGSR